MLKNKTSIKRFHELAVNGVLESYGTRHIIIYPIMIYYSKIDNGEFASVDEEHFSDYQK